MCPPRLAHRVHPVLNIDGKFYKSFCLRYAWCTDMSEVYAFTAKLSKLGRGKSLGIYIPRHVAKKMEHLHGKEVIVVVYTKTE